MLLPGGGGGIKQVIGTHIEVQSGHLLGERLLDTAINNGCDVPLLFTGTYWNASLCVVPSQTVSHTLLTQLWQVLVAGTKCMPGIGSLFEPFLKGRTVLGVLHLALHKILDWSFQMS